MPAVRRLICQWVKFLYLRNMGGSKYITYICIIYGECFELLAKVNLLWYHFIIIPFFATIPRYRHVSIMET